MLNKQKGNGYNHKLPDIDKLKNIYHSKKKSCSEIAKMYDVTIGADSKGSNLPEPSKEKIEALIKELRKFTQVKLKQNLNRLIKNDILPK